MKTGHAVALTVGWLLLAVPAGLDSCAYQPPSVVFATTNGPADLKGEFLKGRIGVLQRSYQQNYLIGAFRMLSGVPLTEDEVNSLYPEKPLGNETYPPLPPAAEWLEARKQVAGLPPATTLEWHKTVNLPGLQYSFPNCLEDAFAKASETLATLVAQWGKDDPKTLEWATAQDQVFANCAATQPTIPPPPRDGMDPLLAAHRRYQIAAAYFYAGDLQRAIQGFRQIAGEADSPWREIAPYLVARALLRAGLLNGDAGLFAEGKQQIQAILDDPQSPFHNDSLALLHLWQLRAEPRARFAELSASLMQPQSEDISQTVTDFLFVIRHHPEFTGIPELPAWLAAMSNHPSADASKEATDWLRKTHNPGWLIAALANAGPGERDELIRAAAKIAPTGEAYESVAYYAIRLERKTGDNDDARLWADRALSHNLLRSSRNWILSERLDLARDWNEFLRFSLRRPEPLVPLPTGEAPVFDHDAMHRFDSHVPLALWVDASRNQALPPYLQLRIALTGWLRAVLLSRPDEARNLMQRVVELQPASAALANNFLSARDADEARFAATYVSLWAPSLCPYLPEPETPNANLAAPRAMFTDSNGFLLSCWPEHHGFTVTAPHADDANFLTPEQRSTGAAEARQIESAEPWRATWLLQETLRWTRAHPDDSRSARALHLAVIASRYRATDAETGKYSKEAFELLHQRYPKSEWTALTPYWFK